MTPLTERFIVFDCRGDACVGILAANADAEAPPSLGVVIVVGGPQYRVGSHRHFALLARDLAKAGIPALRFDYRGMGDSEGDARTFDSVNDDISAAIDALQRETGVAQVVLWGLCDGASAALMYAAGDLRVAGIIALNPWARSPQSEASTRLKHYYLRRLFSRDFWRNVISGKFDVQRGAGGLVGAVRNAAAQPTATIATAYLQRMHEGWVHFARPTLFLLSGSDFTAREFEAWTAADKQRAALLRDPRSEVATFAGADHTFSSRAWGNAVTERTIEWIGRVNRRC